MAINGRQRHILVINDTPQILSLFVELLEGEGYRVTTDRFMAEPDRLLAHVKGLRPGLIILDLMIGEEDRGWRFLQQLKMDDAARAIPVVVCTAAIHHVQEIQTQLDQLAVAVVLRPFDIDHLLEVVAGAWEAATEQ